MKLHHYAQRDSLKLAKQHKQEHSGDDSEGRRALFGVIMIDVYCWLKFTDVRFEFYPSNNQSGTSWLVVTGLETSSLWFYFRNLVRLILIQSCKVRQRSAGVWFSVWSVVTFKISGSNLNQYWTKKKKTTTTKPKKKQKTEQSLWEPLGRKLNYLITILYNGERDWFLINHLSTN